MYKHFSSVNLFMRLLCVSLTAGRSSISMY